MPEEPSMPESTEEDRRSFMERAAGIAMGAGLVAGYGTLGCYGIRYLYPADAGRSIWQFVCTLDQLSVGESMPFTMPSGAQIMVTRQSEEDSPDSFIALSSVCPHLGCQVHWEANNDRFFCPCHNGTFDAQGQPTGGPPAAAGQPLTRFHLHAEGNLLMIQVPVNAIRIPDTTA